MQRIGLTFVLAMLVFAGSTLSTPALAADRSRDIVVHPQGTGRWLRAESDHVIVYSDESPAVLRRVVEDVEALDQTLRTIYGKLDGPPPRKFPIYLVRAPGRDAVIQAQNRGDKVKSDYRRFLPDAVLGALSVDVAEPDDIFAVVVRDSFSFHRVVDETAGDDGVLGAYALHFFSENFPFRQPRWLIKGAALYYSSIDIQPDHVVIGGVPALFDSNLMSRNLYAVPHLIAERGGWSDPQRWGYDAQAAVLVRYLWSDPRRKTQLATYLDRLEAVASDPKTVWGQVFDDPPERMEEPLRAFLAAPAIRTTLPRSDTTPPTIRIRRMPRGADDLILEVQRLKTNPGFDPAGLLMQFRKAAARRPSERYSRQALARAEILLGDRDKGEQLLAGLLDEDGGNLEALRLMGMSKLYRAAADSEHRGSLQAVARGYLERADKAEPNDYLTLFLLAQTMAADGVPSPERLALLRRAVGLAPEVAKIRIVAAAAFMMTNDTHTAFQLLKPISADPNGGLAALQAQKLLAEMEGAKRP